MKKFIMVIPLQRFYPTRYVYDPSDTPKLVFGETALPILPVMANTVQAGDAIEVIAIRTLDSPAPKNWEGGNAADGSSCKGEIEAWAREAGVEVTFTLIDKPNTENIDVYIQLFSQLLNQVDEEDELSACVTYGTKPTQIVQMMALNYAYKLKSAKIGSIVYGDVKRNPGKDDIATLHDVSALFYMDSIVHTMANIGVRHPEKAIREMLELKEVKNDAGT